MFTTTLCACNYSYDGPIKPASICNCAWMQARNMSLPTGTLYVAEAGFLLERAQVWMQLNSISALSMPALLTQLALELHTVGLTAVYDVVALACFAGAKACAADGA
jgi:hypothetical protein